MARRREMNTTENDSKNEVKTIDPEDHVRVLA